MRQREPAVTGLGHDRDAEDRLAAIYERYASHVAAYALRRTGSTDAADVVAETFLVAWRRRDAVPEEPSTLPWLYGVARRVLANQRRTTHRRRRLSNRLASEFAARAVAPPGLDDVEEFREVAAALRNLSDEDAELLRLTAWEALSPSEIAAVFEIAPGTARQRVSRARQRLRKQLAEDRAVHLDDKRYCGPDLPSDPPSLQRTTSGLGGGAR
ncbi:MAG: sigma-70 family RNA polymerase sigma factor [Actinomycetota bacterium]